MQHPAVMSSFPPHWPVWLQFCQSWACSVAFKITMTFFDNAHMCKTEAKKLKKFTHVFSPLYTNVKHESEIRTDTHTCEHEYYLSYVLSSSYFPSSSFALLSHVIARPQILSFPPSFMTWAKSFNLSPYVRAPIPSHFSSTLKHMTRTHVLCGFC